MGAAAEAESVDVGGQPAERLRVTLVQTEPILRDPARALALMEHAVAEASAAAADAAAGTVLGEEPRIFVFPEMFLTGYAIGPANVRRLAEPATGRWFASVARLARVHGCAIAYGYPELGERPADGGTADQDPADGALVYNSVNLVSESGELLAAYRKTHLYGEVDRGQFAPGERLPEPVGWHGWKLGLGICYDVEFPEFVRAQALAGIDLLLVPTANMTGLEAVAGTLVPARAYENQVYVGYANYTGADEVFAYHGLSTLAGPTGAVLAQGGAASASEGYELVTAVLRRAQLQASRQVATYLADRRSDLYS
ncbi:carbon-nitrogen hydrolase family protein [Brevibacterium sp. 91QC2O2]|uniref:carbon-nitrogen hydrolase family protein n=1 Tax=Brevibacterium sp. 91QC2O2 TaxID=2968458 RepID=UPI00211CAA21|nr:carbon-nitrogen hydrolase family protein [Brevibacterium sp. 91QC2O2]MCQ9369580.1 carbon-nitrogen hydrolase family protein [Brevibacterium sp. 91QC2O2]